MSARRLSAVPIALAVAVISCGRSQERTGGDPPSPAPTPGKTTPTEPAPAKKKTTSGPVTSRDESSAMEITWKLTPADDKLVVDYTVRNTGDKKVWVATRLMQNTKEGRVMKPVDRLIVRPGDAPDLVSLVRGMTYESLARGRERPAPSPEMAAIEPGKSLDGRAEVPLPLESWHNYGVVPPLDGDRQRAVLELSYIDDPKDDAVWWNVPLDDGTKVRAPNPRHLKSAHKRITSDPLPIP